MIGGIIATDFAEARGARLRLSAPAFAAVQARAARADRSAHGRARPTNASAAFNGGSAQGGDS